MQLREAIVKACKWTWKGKQRSPTRCVRFLPPTSINGGGSTIYASNGPQGIMLFLDPEVVVPNVMIEAEKLAATVKAIKEATIEASANETVVISGVRVDGENVNEYPAIPVIPEESYAPLDDWPTIQKLLHAVSKDNQQPILQCLHFRPDLVEATDRFRVARAFVKSPWEGLVPAATFRNLPDGEVWAAFTDEVAGFRVGDELRFSILKRGKFQDCDQLLPAWHDGGTARVDTGEVLALLKRVKALGTACEVTLSGCAVDVKAEGFSERLPALGPATDPTKLHINADWFHEAVRQVSTPLLQLGYTTTGDPLRVESGAYVVGLWPFTGG